MANDPMNEFLEHLAAASPALADELAKARRDWAPDPPPPTLTMGALGQRAIEALDDLGDVELRRVCDVVEEALLHAPDAVKDAVATGLLEAAMTAADTAPSSTRFFGALGPRARAYCRDWDTFTNRRTPGVWD